MTDRRSVVVVSADVGVRSHVRLTLGDARFAVHEADDVVTTMRLVAAEHPALVVIDANLPQGAALGIARSLRDQPETEDIGTLLLVPRGSSVPESAHGVDAVLQVPATSFALLKKVESLLDG